MLGMMHLLTGNKRRDAWCLCKCPTVMWLVWQGAIDDEDEEGMAGSYSAAFARLHNAAFVEPEVLPNVPDTSRYLAESIGRYSQVSTLPQLLGHALVLLL